MSDINIKPTIEQLYEELKSETQMKANLAIQAENTAQENLEYAKELQTQSKLKAKEAFENLTKAKHKVATSREILEKLLEIAEATEPETKKAELNVKLATEKRDKAERERIRVENLGTNEILREIQNNLNNTLAGRLKTRKKKRRKHKKGKSKKGKSKKGKSKKGKSKKGKSKKC
jgi:hypothetical protein